MRRKCDARLHDARTSPGNSRVHTKNRVFLRALLSLSHRRCALTHQAVQAHCSNATLDHMTITLYSTTARTGACWHDTAANKASHKARRKLTEMASLRQPLSLAGAKAQHKACPVAVHGSGSSFPITVQCDWEVCTPSLDRLGCSPVHAAPAAPPRTIPIPCTPSGPSTGPRCRGGDTTHERTANNRTQVTHSDAPSKDLALAAHELTFSDRYAWR